MLSVTIKRKYPSIGTRAYLAASDCGDALIKLRNLPYIRELIEQAPDMDGETPAVLVI